MSSFTSMGVSDYARAVRDELRDLTPEQAHAVLDGLDEHLEEIVAEGTTDLEGALGSPKVYAAELRASAGLPAESRAAHSPSWSPPSIPPETSGPAPLADDESPEIGDEVVHEVLPSAEPPMSGRRVAAARGFLVAALGLLAVVVIRASSPANGFTIVAIAAAVGGLWWMLDRVARYAVLPESWSTRLPLTLAGAATVLAVLLGAQLAEDGTTTYVDVFPPESTVFFGDGFVEVPSIVGVAYRDAVQILNSSGFAVIVESTGDAELDAADSMIVIAMAPGPGEPARPGSVIRLTLTDPTSASPLPRVGPEPLQTNTVTTTPPATVVATTLPVATTTLAPETTLASSTTGIDSTLDGATTIPSPSP